MQELITVKNVWFRYRKDSPWVLKGIDMKVHEGEFLGVIGQNGCGKTTLVKHFNGLLRPTKGDVLVKGLNTRDVETYELAKFVGHVFQYPDSQIFADTIFNEVSFGPRNLGFAHDKVEEAVRSSLERVDLQKDLNARPDSLSIGEKERLAVADIVAMNPDILILDEPTTGQDHLTCEAIMRIARELVRSGRTILLISHDMELVAEWSDRVMLMSNGQIVKDGTPKEIFSDLDLLEANEIVPLQVTSLAKSLGIAQIPITVEEMKRSLMKWLVERNEIPRICEG